MSVLSNLAYIHPEAKIGNNVIIDAFAFIDKNVEIGDGTHIHPHASILSGARIGRNNEIFENAIISATPQDFRWKGENSYVIIGDNNKIREQVIINRSILPEGKTEIGNKSYLMAQSHIGHDSKVGNRCVLGNGVKIAGDVIIDDCCILSSGVIVHENCHIGELSLIKGGCRVNGNVPPYSVMAHNPISYFGVNAYVLRLVNKPESIIEDIAKCYRHVYQTGTSVFNALRRIKDDVDASPERDAIIAFIECHDMQLAAVSLRDRQE